ncbi:MAG: SDR family NAD(P)-dependent oxidoreductase [Proteobacteria bacterium]|nr:MAG: SDR family NAD(P)-dependent oxidoreductase [Pseudomonadota bacterium]
MKTSGNTILITGGGSGIELETARLFSRLGNTVIITGRDVTRLETAVAQISGVHYIHSDITLETDVINLEREIRNRFPSLNIVINNAGMAHYYNLREANVDAFKNAQDEMLTNYLSVVRLNQFLLPLLVANGTAAIVNVTSVVAFIAAIYVPTYAASKAALHSYSQSLRLSFERASDDVEVFELLPPLVNTEFSRAIGGENGMDPADVARALIDGMENDVFEIRPGMTEDLYKLFLSSPETALLTLNN